MTPAAIATDTRGEFAPRVAFDGAGDAIAVWERVATPDFTNEDVAAIAAEIEIVWSRWNRATGTWSAPAELTSNGYLDHAPLLCGPMSNGNLLLVWTKNETNQLMGTGTNRSNAAWSRFGLWEDSSMPHWTNRR